MNLENVIRRDAAVGRWVWLLPLAYAIHVIEEAYGGRGLLGWMIERGGLRLSIADFLGVNFVGLAIIAVATWGARRRQSWLWTLASAGAILLVNGMSHIAASAAVRYYVSGMWTGIAIYIPLGAVLLFRVRRLVRPRVFWAAVAVGFVIHAAVLWVVFGAPGL
ncbi:MAG: HXXEE domain-containing protein [Candidatus Krumholzibacteria bacterium]|nr:HXXEE domain-containing protein [Candidatus Krumholzibacteria bacterium]